MVSLERLVQFLDRELNTAAIPDYPGAVNGLQLACDQPIGRIVAAVDVSLPVIQAAAAGGPGLLMVHHGLFWQGLQPVTGALYRKLQTAMDAGLAIYSSHLPLDVHPRWGNNILLAQAVGLVDPQPFLDHKGLLIGLRGSWSGSRDQLHQRLSEVLAGPVHLCKGGGQEIATVGLITGGGGGEIARVAAAGVDCLITGEGPHWSFTLAEDLGLNLFYGGHYATETFGVKAVSAELKRAFDLPWSFLDHPSGL